MNYQKYKNMIKNKFFACALLLGLTAVALQAQTEVIGISSTGGGYVEDVSAVTIYSVTGLTQYIPSAPVTAVADSGKVFAYWEVISPATVDDVNIYPDVYSDTVTLTLLDTDPASRAVRAVFVNSPVNVTVTSLSSGGIPIGDPVPTYGTNAIPLGTTLYAGVRSPYPGNTGVRYNCTGFTGTGDFISSPNTNTTATITQASTITWNWTTQYLLTLSTVNGGGSTVNGYTANTTWYNAGATITLTAQPASGYVFVNWSGDTNSTTSPITVTMSAAKTIAAVFEPYPELSLDIISQDEDNAHVAGYSYVGSTLPSLPYNTRVSITVDPTVVNGSGQVREHCMGYTSTGSVTPTSLATEISAIAPFDIKVDTTITLDWVREYRVRLGIAGTDSTNGYSVSYLTYSPNRTYTSPPWFQAGDSVTISASSLTAGEVFLQWDTTAFGINPFSQTNTFIVSGAGDINALFANSDLDSDLDGMPDTWERDYGLDIKTPNAFEDPDNDGLSNLQEYIISQVLLAAGTVPTDISPIDADSDNDGMIDGYEYNHILITGSGTAVGQSQNALAVVSVEGDNGPNGNPDQDFHWDTNDGYEDTTLGLLNIEEYNGPDNVKPYNFVIVNDTSLSIKPIRQAQVNTLDNYDTSFSDTTDSESAGGLIYGDGFDDGFEYSWDQWQGGHGGESARDPMNHVVPDRFGISALPLAVVNADVDGDGIQDLIVVCYGQELVSVLIGDGDAGFAAPITYQLDTGVNPMSLVADDFNADGFIDVITANADGSYSVLFGTGDITDLFPVITTYPLGSSFIAVESADLDGADGPDLVFADLNNAVYVALNDGAGTFSSSLLALSAVPGDIKLAPIYTDTASTINDLVVTLANDTFEIFANDGVGGFTSTTTKSLPASSLPGACDVADFDANGYNDIATVCTGDNYVRVYLNFDGSGVFNPSDSFLVQNSAGLVDIVAGDFTTYDNSNPSVIETIDLAVVGYDLATVFLYSGNGLGKFGNSGSLATSEGPTCLLLAELRVPPEDTTRVYLDLIVVESLTDSLVEFLNNGSGNFSGYAQFDVSDRIVDRRFNPALIHIQDDVFGRPDYDLVYYIQTGRAVAWFTDFLEYNASQDGGQTIGNYLIPQIIGGSSAVRRSSHPFYWDADGDGLPDGWEIAYGYDPWAMSTFGAINDADANPDGDWFAVQYDDAGNVTAKNKEIYDANGFHPSTGYGYMPPWAEPGPNTGIFNNLQELLGSSYIPAIRPNDPNDGGTCPIALDADGDGVWDGWELYVGMDPANDIDAGEDWDVLNVYWWITADPPDGLPNAAEFLSFATSTNELGALYHIAGWYNKTLPTDPYDCDTDWDQVYDAAEQGYFNFSDTANGGGLCPTAVDTDGDRIPDAWEANFPGGGDTNGWSGGMNGTAHDAYLDYDNDGLLNYQEYFTGANYGWRHDYFIPNMGAGAYDPYDFFSESFYGRLPKEWDPSYILDAPINRVNLHFMLGYEGIVISRGGPWVPYFQTSDPTDEDSDFDGMDDYWEVFHGLNPLYGYKDVVDGPISLVSEQFPPYSAWHSARDFNQTPWIVGFPNFDADQDGLVNYEEAIFVNAIPYHHTDPSSMWMTDISAQLSYVNLYYWTGWFAANAEWYWADSLYGGAFDLPNPRPTLLADNAVIMSMGMIPAPRFAYSFEINEGYDTDNDGISDLNEINGTDVSLGVTDPLDNMSPNINRALYLNGEAYTETPFLYGWTYPDYRTYTVEAWVKAEELPTAKKQIVMQRGGDLSNADQFNPEILGWRRNFELGLTKEGKPYILFDTPVGDTFEAVANFAVETDKWYHISGSYEGDYNSQDQWVGKLNVYLDGVLVKSLPVSSMPANSYQGASVQVLGAMTFTVGNSSPQEDDPNDYFFKGWVDNARAWGAYQDQDTIQANMRTTFNRAQATYFATNEATRLLYCFSFNDLPDPQIDNITPDGFDALVGYPANYTAIPFWRSMADRSKVYNDYLYLPWIDNQSLHYPRPVASDTVMTNNVYGANTTPPVNYPNTSDPYGYKYLTGTIQAITQDPAIGSSPWSSYESIIHPDLLANVPVAADMLPMLYATTTESVEMWDNISARMIDSDGDGMPDVWEVAMGLDPFDATGVNGAYGDYDRDGLSNYYEYQAGTDPDENASTTNDVPDFFAWGNNLTGDLNHDYRTFGELLTDHDMMEDEWEVNNGLSPYLFDAFRDLDGDGWSNYNEFRYGSDPQDQESIASADLTFRFKYAGADTFIPPGTVLRIFNYTDFGQAPDCAMLHTIAVSGGVTKSEGVTGLTGTLTDPPTSGTCEFIDVLGNVYDDNGKGGLISSATNAVGTIGYVTGDWTLPVDGVTATYTTGGSSHFPLYVDAGHLFEVSFATKSVFSREGLTHFFVFADRDGNGLWDPATEPAGTADNGPLMMTGGSPGLIDISLKNYAPGFGRLAWTPNDYAVGYRVNVSKGASSLFTADLDQKKYFMNENDFVEFYGNALPSGTIKWSVDLLTQTGTYSNNYASGTFVVGYYSSLKTPTIVSPSTMVKCSTYRNTFIWDNADKEAAFYDIQIATNSTFSNIVLTKTGYIPVDYAQHSQITLPELGSGFEWEEKTYYWRVRSRNNTTVGTWSVYESFRIHYESDESDIYYEPEDRYTHSIAGTVYYTGKAKTGNIVVEAYDNDAFSGTPLSLDVIPNDPVPELWPLSPYSYKLPGLPNGTYYARAFLDQNNNYLKDSFETYGYVTDGKDVYVVAPITLSTFTGNVTSQTIYTVVADTDNDLLADDWEFSYLGSLSIVGAGEVRGFTDYDNNGVNDFEAYAWSALNMSPLNGDAAGIDNIPYVLKSDFGLCVTEDIDFSLKGIDIDKYGNLNISWSGLGGASYITLSHDNGSKALSVTAGSSTVQYTLQYSTDMSDNSWIDVETGEKSEYYENSDMFLYTGPIPSVSAIENNEPLFFRFQVTW